MELDDQVLVTAKEVKGDIADGYRLLNSSVNIGIGEDKVNVVTHLQWPLIGVSATYCARRILF